MPARPEDSFRPGSGYDSAGVTQATAARVTPAKPTAGVAPTKPSPGATTASGAHFERMSP